MIFLNIYFNLNLDKLNKGLLTIKKQNKRNDLWDEIH